MPLRPARAARQGRHRRARCPYGGSGRHSSRRLPRCRAPARSARGPPGRPPGPKGRSSRALTIRSTNRNREVTHMGMVRRRIRRRTMMVVGEMACAAGRNRGRPDVPQDEKSRVRIPGGS